MSTTNQKPALLLIDIQKGFEDETYWGGNRNNPEAESVAGKVLALWRNQKWPIFHVQHSSTNPKSRLHESNPGFAFQEIVAPLEGEPVIRKNVNSAFIGTDLKAQLEAQNIRILVIAGLTTNHCVSTTTRMAGNFGFEVYLLSDATATFDRKGVNGELFSSEVIHQTTLANLQDEFAQVIPSETLLEMFSLT